MRSAQKNPFSSADLLVESMGSSRPRQARFPSILLSVRSSRYLLSSRCWECR